MNDVLETVLECKTAAKARRNRGRYEAAIPPLEKAVGVLIAELKATAATAPERRRKLAAELADCHGMMGGIYRRWALTDENKTGREALLLKSVKSYQEGYTYESNEKEEYGIVGSYNRINRLVSWLLLHPDALDGSAMEEASEGLVYKRDDLERAEAIIREQLKDARRDDIWALADLALVSLLLDKEDAQIAYAPFHAKSPPDYAYESALDTLRPLAQVDLPVTVSEKLQGAIQQLEDRLSQIRV